MTTSTPDTQKSAESAFYRARVGIGYLSKGKKAQALSEMLAAESMEPKNPIYKNYLAIAYYELEQYGRAEEFLFKALALKPNYTEARTNLARLYIDLGRIDEALGELRTSSDDLTYPHQEKVQYLFGLAYLRSGEYLKSEQHFHQSLKVKRNFCPSLQLYGQALYHTSNYHRAIETLRESLKTCDSGQDETNYYIGLSYFKLGNSSLALSTLNGVVEKFPKSQFSTRARSTLRLIR